jgi:cytochrome c556
MCQRRRVCAPPQLLNDVIQRPLNYWLTEKGAIVKAVTILALPLGLVLLLGAPGISQQEKGNREFMRAKLKHSQEIVEGLALENFDQIVKNAQQLSLLSHATNWDVFQTEEYLMQSREFRRATESLRAQAKEKNLDGAVLAYLDVTMKCVNCHKYVRGIRMAKLDRP